MNIPTGQGIGKGHVYGRCGDRGRHSRRKLSLHLWEVTGNEEIADFYIMLFRDVGTNTTRVKELSQGNRKDRRESRFISSLRELCAYITDRHYIKKKACH